MVGHSFTLDAVLGSQRRREAEWFLQHLRERMQSFGMALHPEKTRLLRFGRFAGGRRRRQGRRRPETSEFLRLAHICGRTYQSGRFIGERKSAKARLRNKLHEVRRVLTDQRHVPIPAQGGWLGTAVQG